MGIRGVRCPCHGRIRFFLFMMMMIELGMARVTMRRPKERKRTLALLNKSPWEGRQAIRSTRNPNAIVKSIACGTKSKKRKKKK